MTSTSGVVTDPSTPMGGMSGYVVPPPGLTPPDFSIWSVPPSAPRATCIPIILASHGEGYLTEGRYRQAGSGYEGYGTTGSNAVGSKITNPTAAGSSDGATHVPATPNLRESASNPIPAGSTAKPKGRGVTFDSSTDKVAAIGSQDANGRRRQRTRD